ncbi:MAG: hypothetical protein AB1414_20400 [bacterium]
MKKDEISSSKVSLFFIYILIFLSSITISEANDAILWPEFKLPPHYDTERKAIRESDALRIKEEYKKYEEEREKNEAKYRKFYEEMYRSNPEFLKRNPYRYQEFKPPKTSYDAIALLDIDGDGQTDNAFVVAEIFREGKFVGHARIARYQKGTDGSWKYVASINTDSDIGIKKAVDDFVIAGCQKDRIFLSPRGSGLGIYIQDEAKKLKSDDKEIRLIVQEELKVEIQKEKSVYKKETNRDYKEELRIAGINQDVNSDGKPDIIAIMNDPKYMYMYPDGNRMPTGSRFQLFCQADKGCQHFLLLNKGERGWEKVPLGYSNCIGLSSPKENGMREIFMRRATLRFEDSAYKIVPYYPNWVMEQ